MRRVLGRILAQLALWLARHRPLAVENERAVRERMRRMREAGL